MDKIKSFPQMKKSELQKMREIGCLRGAARAGVSTRWRSGVEWGGVEWSEERNNGMMVRLSEHPSNSYSPHVERSDFSTDDCL